MSSGKTIETLVEDIYALLDEDNNHVCSEDNLEAAAELFKDVLRRRLAHQERKTSLRFSNLGKPDCQIWHKVNHPEQGEKLSPQVQMKFMYGDILEVLLLFLAQEAGHEVKDTQREVECDGVKGHLDAIIDGVVVDAKSASPFAFDKFVKGTLEGDDPFGYIPQLAGYCHATGIDRGGFLVINKESGGICFSPISEDQILRNHPSAAIARQRKVVDAPDLPSRFPALPDGKSGNQKLDTLCSYCDFKKFCWRDSNNGQGLRTFLYAGRPRFLTTVVREPDVKELV